MGEEIRALPPNQFGVSMAQTYHLLLECGHTIIFGSEDLPDDFDLAHDEFTAPCVVCGHDVNVTFATIYHEAADKVTHFTQIFQ